MSDVRQHLETKIGEAMEGKYSHLKAQDRAMALNDIMYWIDLYMKDSVTKMGRDISSSLKEKKPHTQVRIGQLDFQIALQEKMRSV